MNSENILEMQNISKSFSDNVVLNDVSFFLKKGEVHSLVGANGAGKSTLVKILNGIYSADSGQIFFEGKKVSIKQTEDAKKHGISFVHQELNICPDLSVAENIFIGNLEKNKFGLYDLKKTVKKAEELLEMIHIDLDVNEKVRNLRAAEKQIIEILKALTMNEKILVLDEPTSSLNEKEKEIFINIVQKLKSQGVSIVFISHFLEDILLISDRITVIKDGVNNGLFEAATTSKEQLITAMMGKSIIQRQERIQNKENDDKPVLQIDKLCATNKFNDINLSVNAGEIVGICGLLGAGKSEIARAIFGLEKMDSGQIIIDGEVMKKPTPRKMMNKKVCFVSEERKTEGFVPLLSINENITLSIYKDISNSLGFILDKKQRELADALSKKMTVKCSSVDQNVVSLSGGNQQKVVIGRCVASNPKIFMLDEPTRGVDVFAKSEIYEILSQMAREGVAIMIFSSELEELLETCDKIVILKKGQISGVIKTSETDKNQLLAMIS